MATPGTGASAPERTSPTAPRRSTTALVALPVTLLLAGLTATVAPAVAHAPQAVPDSGSAEIPDSLDRDLYLPFDELTADGLPLLEAFGSSEVAVSVSAAGGQVAAGPDRFAEGSSLRLERFRRDEPATPAVVVVRPVEGAVDPTDPGGRNFAFGAEFALDEVTGRSSTDNGDNLVQRGLFGPDSQYKIQVDNGRPSCRVKGSEGTVNVHASEAVQPEHWYRVRCRRVGDQVILRVVTSVDAVKQIREYVAEGAIGSVSFSAGDPPFSIGGKVDAAGQIVATDSDQFNGLVDDVFFRSMGRPGLS